MNLGISVPLCGLLIYRHYLQFQYDKMKKYLKFSELFRKSNHLCWGLAEAVLHLIMSVPYIEWNVCYHSNNRQVCHPFSNFIMFVAVFRFYLCTRVYFHFCEWTKPENDKVCD